MLLVISILFTLLQLAAAFFLVIISIHGPDSLPKLTLIWLILTQAILWTWFLKFRTGNNKNAAVYQIFLGVAIIATAPVVFFIADKYDTYKYNDILANTKLSNIHDELLLTDDGQPFGIKFSFRAEFPQSEHIYITPLLRPQANPSGSKPDPNDMQVLRYSTNPPLNEHYFFKKGVSYEIEFELVPGYLIERQVDIVLADKQYAAKFCLQYPIENVQYLTRDQFEELITINNPDHYLVMLHGTTYGDTYSGKGPAYTQNKYNPIDFYNTYKIKKISECEIK